MENTDKVKWFSIAGLMIALIGGWTLGSTYQNRIVRDQLHDKYQFSIDSLQSIIIVKNHNLNKSADERKAIRDSIKVVLAKRDSIALEREELNRRHDEEVHNIRNLNVDELSNSFTGFNRD